MEPHLSKCEKNNNKTFLVKRVKSKRLQPCQDGTNSRKKQTANSRLLGLLLLRSSKVVSLTPFLPATHWMTDSAFTSGAAGIGRSTARWAETK